MWNTGCNNIGNALAVGINLLDGEDQHLAITVAQGGTADWKSVIFPWCSTTNEVRNKAFRVANTDSGAVFMYLFQDYHTNKVCWSLDMNDPWNNKSYFKNGSQSANDQQPLSAVDIFIMPDKIWALAAESENTLFKTIFDEAVAVAAAGGQIASAILTAAKPSPKKN